MSLNNLEREVYKRQMMIDGWGEPIQDRLKDATVFVAGAGGLGSPAAIYLAVAGVGHLRVCDFDSPDYSNLNRQILHDPSRIGINKAVSAKKTLESLTGLTQVLALAEKITAESVDRLVGDAQIIVDCMDNFDTRYLLNACAMRKGIPLVHGSVHGMEGRISFFHAPETACLRCIFPEAPAKEVFPILGATPGVIGTLQALQVLKYLTGIGEVLKNKLLVWDGEYDTFHTLQIQKDPACPDCGVIPAQKTVPLALEA